MAIGPAKFNSQEFFEKTAYYGSQGRGLFTILNLPSIVQPLRTNSQILANRAESLLSSGIIAKTISSSSSSLATFEEFSYNGPTRKHPHTQIFGPITVEFYLMGENQLKAGQFVKVPGL